MSRKSQVHTTNQISYLSELQRIGHQYKQTDASKSSLYYILEQFEEYCRQSTLHGLKYIRDANLSTVDKIFWFAVFLLSLILSSVVMLEVWDDWMTHPFLMLYDSKITSIWEIPFPSVTICTYYMVKKSYLNKNTSLDRRMKYYLKRACGEKIPNVAGWNDVRDYGFTEDDFYQFLLNATPSCNELFNKCEFKNEVIDCCSFFQPILTQKGYCYMFNNMPLEILYKNIVLFTSPPLSKNAVYWRPGIGYPIRNSMGIEEGVNDSVVLPLWTEYPGEENGLSIELVQNVNDWLAPCSGGLSGFQVVAHSPADLPIIISSTLHIPSETETVMILKPTTITTDQDLISIPSWMRRCYYEHERKLQHFRFYTQKNCLIDCYISITIELCGCTFYFLPRTSSVRWCYDTDDACLLSFIGKLMNGSLISKLRNPNCDCFSPCSEILYEIDNYNSPIVTPESKPPWAPGYNADRSEEKLLSRLKVYFKTQQFNGLHRERQVSLHDFLGNCGGLLGMFLGFSFISTFELLYFLVIRPVSQLLHKTDRKFGWLPRRTHPVHIVHM